MVLLMNTQEHYNWPKGKRTISCDDVNKLITDINKKCFFLMRDLNTRFNIAKKRQIFLIAGNHDLYECDFIKKEDGEDCLQKVKNNSLDSGQLLKFVKFKVGNKKIVFKHSPYLSQDALDKIKRKKDRQIQDNNIRKYPNQNYRLQPKHLYYWKYANDNWEDKDGVKEKTIFCNNERDNENISQQLKENNYYMVFGHCGITASNSSTYSIIDKNWNKYQYSKFSIDKEQLKHEVYDAKNKIITTYQIPNFEKAQRIDEKFNNKKLSIVSNNEIYSQRQKKNFDVLEVKKQKQFSIKNNGLKKEQSTKTEHKITVQRQTNFSLNNIDKSNTYFNSCCDKIYNICS